MRLFPHPPNFAPLGAAALFAGVYFRRKLALFLPLLIMIISDVFIGYYEISLMITVYGSFLLCVILGFWLKKHKNWQNILAGSFLAGLIFFLLTNFSVWLFTPWYSKDISGLLYCYTLALPFFRNTLAGNVFYAFSFFGIYEMARSLIAKRFRVNNLSYSLSAIKNKFN